MAPDDRPTFVTTEMARQAVCATDGPVPVLRLLLNIMRAHDRRKVDFDASDAKRLCNLALNERWGVYYFVGPRGGISRRGFVGLEAARFAAHGYSPRAKLVMVKNGGGFEHMAETAVRFLAEFNDDEVVERLLELTYQHLDDSWKDIFGSTSAERLCAIMMARAHLDQASV